MSFSSISFLIFMVAVFLLYWVLPHKLRWPVLLAANVLFYASFETKYLVLILLLTVVSYFCGILLEKKRKHAKLILVLSVLFTLSFLLVYKYTGFALESVRSVCSRFAIPLSVPMLKIVQPLGISFFTFQIVGYLADVYKGKTTACTHPGKYAVFVSFFPNITSGPIERAAHFLPQLDEEKKFDYEKAVAGASLLLVGLFKKIVIADTLASYADRVFNSPADFAGPALLLAILLYTVQIYCDFSGYSDMAVGIARLLGFDLIENFKYPYFSHSIKEFWSRWHISLSTWLRDYVYIPLGGSRVSKARRNFNLIVTFLVSGIWHGANWTFVLWGLIHGIAQAIETSITEFARKKRAAEQVVKIRRGSAFLKWLYTTAVVCLAWVFFRANSLSDAFLILRNLLRPAPLGASLTSMNLSGTKLLTLGGLLLILAGYDYFDSRSNLIAKFRNLKWPIRWVVYTVLAVIVIVMKLHNGADAGFIYFSF